MQCVQVPRGLGLGADTLFKGIREILQGALQRLHGARGVGAEGLPGLKAR